MNDRNAPQPKRWRQLWTRAASLIVVITTIGCASPEITPPSAKMQEKPARPNRILVYDFVVIGEDIAVDAPLAARLSTRSKLTPEQVEMERQLGAEMSGKLTHAIKEMGLPAERAATRTPPGLNDVIIRGYFVSLHETNAVRRFTIGLDPNAVEIMTAVEVYHIVPPGISQPVGSGLDTAAEKSLAAAVGTGANPAGIIVTRGTKNIEEANRRAVVEAWSKEAVAEVLARLKARFQAKGWVG